MSQFLRSDHKYSGHPETVIQNYIIRTKKDMIWPLAYRALDCGWYGANKPGCLSGSLDDKISILRRALIDLEVSNHFIKEPFVCPQSMSTGLYIGYDHRPSWQADYKAQQFWGF